jgi:type IV secretory pathway TrbF-like protein
LGVGSEKRPSPLIFRAETDNAAELIHEKGNEDTTMEAIAHKNWSPDKPLDTRYRKARQEWDTRMGSAIAQARNWRLATLFSLGLVLLSLLGMIYLGAQPKAVPHIVQVDRIGAPTYFGPIGQSVRDYHPTDAVLKYHLRRFIDETRTVSSDAAVMKRNWIDAYTLITQSAGTQLNAYAQQNDPFKRMQNERISVDVANVVQLSKDTWQADWRETNWDKGGSELGTTIWRGTFRVLMRVPENEEQLVTNPIGLFVDEFHWSKVQG